MTYNVIVNLSLEVDSISFQGLPKIQIALPGIELPGIIDLVKLNYAKCQPKVTLAFVS